MTEIGTGGVVITRWRKSRRFHRDCAPSARQRVAPKHLGMRLSEALARIDAHDTRCHVPRLIRVARESRRWTPPVSCNTSTSRSHLERRAGLRAQQVIPAVPMTLSPRSWQIFPAYALAAVPRSYRDQVRAAMAKPRGNEVYRTDEVRVLEGCQSARSTTACADACASVGRGGQHHHGSAATLAASILSRPCCMPLWASRTLPVPSVGSYSRAADQVSDAPAPVLKAAVCRVSIRSGAEASDSPTARCVCESFAPRRHRLQSRTAPSPRRRVVAPARADTGASHSFT